MNNCSTNDDTAVACTDTQTNVTFTKPHYRAKQDEAGYSLRVYVPGVGKSGVTLKLAKDLLTITAKRSDTTPEGWTPLSRELSTDDYQLRLHLDTKIDSDRITAKLEDGVLDVALPLKEAAQPRVIDVA
jgi:HSP20 family protein